MVRETLHEKRKGIIWYGTLRYGARFKIRTSYCINLMLVFSWINLTPFSTRGFNQIKISSKLWFSNIIFHFILKSINIPPWKIVTFCPITIFSHCEYISIFLTIPYLSIYMVRSSVKRSFTMSYDASKIVTRWQIIIF